MRERREPSASSRTAVLISTSSWTFRPSS
jgi:hypothetical protein